MVKIASLCVPSFWHNIGVWRTGGQTDIRRTLRRAVKSKLRKTKMNGMNGPSFAEVDPGTDDHARWQMVILSAAWRQQSVDRQHLGVDAAPGMRRFQLGRAAVQRILDADQVSTLIVVITDVIRRCSSRWRHWRMMISAESSLKLAHHVVAQRYHDNGIIIHVLQPHDTENTTERYTRRTGLPAGIFTTNIRQIGPFWKTLRSTRKFTKAFAWMNKQSSTVAEKSPVAT